MIYSPTPVAPPFQNIITTLARNVVSPQDKRDFILAPPSATHMPKKVSYRSNRQILNQEDTDYCTAFATYRCACMQIAGVGRKDFPFSSEYAMEIARWQMGWINRNIVKKVFRMAIWLWRGRNARAALWNLHKGVVFKNGDILKINSYSRAMPKSPEDLCRYLSHYGPFAVVMKIRGYFVQGEYRPFTGNKVMGYHEIVIDGYNLDREQIYFANSWGGVWGNGGGGTISFRQFDDLLEFWRPEGAKFYKHE